MAESITNDQEGEYSIKPQKHTPALNTSEWPLLLKVCAFYPTNPGLFSSFRIINKC